MSVDDVRAEALRCTVRGDREDFGDLIRKEVGGIGHVPGLSRK